MDNAFIDSNAIVTYTFFIYSIFFSDIYIDEFNGGGLTVQNNFAHTINQNILNCHVN